MSFSTYIVTVIGISDTIVNREPATANDINNAAQIAKDIAADFIMISGNVVTGIGATAGLLSREIPGAGLLFKEMETLGVGLTLLGSGIKNYDAIINGVPIAWEELKIEVGEKIESIKNILSEDLVNVSEEVSAAWDSTKESLLNTLDKFSNVISDVGTSAFDSQACR